MPLPEVVARRWTEAKAALESSARSGSRPDSGVDVEAILEEMARLVRAVGREELEAVARASGATPLPAALGPVATLDLAPAGDPAETTDGLTANRGPGETTDLPPVFVVGTPEPGVSGVLATGAEGRPFDANATGAFADTDSAAPERTGDYTPGPAVGPTPRNTPDEHRRSTRKIPTVPGYEITGVLGRGGMGVVYRATQLGLRRTVALKMILAGEHASGSQLERFAAEARAVALIHHPGIVQIYEIGEHDGLPFFSLEFCPGGSLDRALDHKPQPPREAAALTEKLVRAMAAAHAAGVVHRDLKPANVLLDAAGEPKVTDFGLARELDDASGNTRTGSILGTPSYMAPEQALGNSKAVGPAADQYSLGATLYELITGRPPFHGANAMETVAQVRTREPVAPTQLRPTCPKDLETICLKTLQKDPAKRYASCAALADDLRAFLDGRPIAARPVGRAEKAWRWAKRNPRIAALTGTIALLLVLLAAGGSTAAVVFANKRREAVELSEARRIAQEDAEAKRIEAEAAREKEAVALKVAEAKRIEAESARKDEAAEYAYTRETVFTALDEIPLALSQAVFARAAEQEVVAALGAMLQKQIGREFTRKLPARAVYNFQIKMGDLMLRGGKPADAEKHYKEALALSGELLKTDAQEKDKAKANHALVLRRLATLARDTRRDGATALKGYADAMALQREVVERPTTGEIPASEAKASLAATLRDIAETYFRMSVFDKALPPAEESLKLWGEVVKAPPTPYTASAKQMLADARLTYGRVQERRGNDPAARDALAAAAAEYKTALAAKPTSLPLQIAAARAYREYGDYLLMRGELAAATPYHEWDLALSRGLLRSPELLAAQSQLADVCYRSATLALKKGDRPAADKLYRQCLDLRLAVAEAYPNDLRQPIRVANAQARVGQHAAAAKTMEELVVKSKGDPLERYVVRQAAFTLAICPDAVQAGRPDEKLTAAEKVLRDGYADRAVALLEDLVARLGYTDVVQLKTDPDLDAIRAHPGFKALVRKLETPPKP